MRGKERKRKEREGEGKKKIRERRRMLHVYVLKLCAGPEAASLFLGFLLDGVPEHEPTLKLQRYQSTLWHWAIRVMSLSMLNRSTLGWSVKNWSLHPMFFSRMSCAIHNLHMLYGSVLLSHTVCDTKHKSGQRAC